MSKSSDLDTQHLLSPDEERVPSYGSTRYAAINASISSRSSSEDGTGEGERVWIVACFSVIACVSSVLNGLVLGYSSGTLIELKKIYQKGDTIHGFLDTSTYASLFGSFGALGAALGAPCAWPITEWFGRKPALMLGGVPGVIGWLMITCGHYVPSQSGFLVVLLLGRILTGFQAGWSVFCVSVYIAEIATANLKGLFGACNQFFAIVGVFLSLGLGALANTSNMDKFHYFHISVVAIGITAVFELLMLFTCETPRWLYAQGEASKGLEKLKLLRGPSANVATEEAAIRAAFERQGKLSVKDLFLQFRHRPVYHPFVLVLMLMFFQQFGGINAVVFFAASIYQEAGVKDPTLLSALSIGVSQLIVTSIAVVLVDLLGRKVLFIVSSITMCLSSCLLGIKFLITDTICDGATGNGTTSAHAICHHSIGWLAILAAIGVIIGFSVGWGPIPWLMMSELLPLRVRSLGGSVATFFNWSCATIITVTFESYASAISPKFAWWSFSIVMLVSIFCVIFFLPETKGCSLEQIEAYFQKGSCLSTSFSSSTVKREIHIADSD